MCFSLIPCSLSFPLRVYTLDFRSSLSSEFISVGVKFGVTFPASGRRPKPTSWLDLLLKAMQSRCTLYHTILGYVKARIRNVFDEYCARCQTRQRRNDRHRNTAMCFANEPCFFVYVVRIILPAYMIMEQDDGTWMCALPAELSCREVRSFKGAAAIKENNRENCVSKGGSGFQA